MGKWSQREYEQQLCAKIKILFERSFQDSLDRPSGYDPRFKTFIRQLDANNANIQAAFHSVVQTVITDQRLKRQREHHDRLRTHISGPGSGSNTPIPRIRRPIPTLERDTAVPPRWHRATVRISPDPLSLDQLSRPGSPSAIRRGRTRSASPPSPSAAARQIERHATEQPSATPNMTGDLDLSVSEGATAAMVGGRDWLDGYASRREERQRLLRSANERRSNLEDVLRGGGRERERRRREREDDDEEGGRGQGRLVRRRTTGNLRAAAAAAADAEPAAGGAGLPPASPVMRDTRRDGIVYEPSNPHDYPWDNPVEFARRMMDGPLGALWDEDDVRRYMEDIWQEEDEVI